MSGHIGDMVSQEYNTPENILDAVRRMWAIGLDPCDNIYSTTNAVVSYKLPDKDGLVEPWHDLGPVFCNPPYGRSILTPERKLISPDEFKALTPELQKLCKRTSLADWVAKAAQTHKLHQTEIILLIPSATETTFWHESIWYDAAAICFISGRVSHPIAGKPAPAPSTKGSAVIYYGNDPAAFSLVFASLGKVVPVGK